jgi:hypothetical protein
MDEGWAGTDTHAVALVSSRDRPLTVAVVDHRVLDRHVLAAIRVPPICVFRRVLAFTVPYI